MDVGPPVMGLDTWAFTLATLHVSALALTIVLALAWGRHAGRRRLVAAGFLAVSAIVSTYVLAVRPADIPTEWLTILHHGLGRKAIMHLYGQGVHAGPNFAAVLSAVAPGYAPRLHDVVWLNLALAPVNAALFFLIATRGAGIRWAIVWTLVFALNPAMFLAAFSELPTNLLALYFLAGVIAWALLNDPLPQPRALRAAALGSCALLTMFAGLTRAEVALLGVTAMAVQVAVMVVAPAGWSAAWHWLGDRLRGPLAYLSARPAAVVALCLLGMLLTKSGVPGLVGRSEMAGLYPFNPSFLSLVAYLQMLLLPLGVSLAVGLGFVHGFRHFRLFGGLALSLLVLVRAYFAAEYQYFEMGRYVSYILPAILLLGVFGRAELDRIVRPWRASWAHAARILYLMAWFTLPLPGIVEFYARPGYTFAGGFSQLLLDRDTQREVRHLVALTEANPECVFVGRVIIDLGDPKVDTRYAYVVFGVPIPQPIVVPEADASLADVIARHAGAAACVRLYHGSDCNLTFTDRCAAFIAGRRPLHEERFCSRPYNNTLQSGHAASDMVLSDYAWP